MRILHISDLHVPSTRSLTQVWGPVEACLRLEDRFDFVVVSGDLSERAQPAEFEALEELITEDVMRWLPDDDRSRIIFVPGNHDVLWDDAHFNPVLAGHDTVAAAESVRRDPHRSNYRSEVTKLGELRLWEIKQPEHSARLGNVQAFFDKFYGGSLAAKPQKKLMLLAPGEDWSCHAFLDQGIAFIGLNSCHRNDKYWHGAGFDPQAINAASRHVYKLRQQKPNLLVVAVWHHGFASDSARPDRL